MRDRPGHRDGDDVPAIQFPYWQWLSLALAASIRVGRLAVPQAAWANLSTAQPRWTRSSRYGHLRRLLWSLYALFFGTAGTPGMTHPFRADDRALRRAANIYLEVGAGVTMFILASRYFGSAPSARPAHAAPPCSELGAKEVSVLRGGQERRSYPDDLRRG